jgi:hypothetical protein
MWKCGVSPGGLILLCGFACLGSKLFGRCVAYYGEAAKTRTGTSSGDPRSEHACRREGEHHPRCGIAEREAR